MISNGELAHRLRRGITGLTSVASGYEACKTDADSAHRRLGMLRGTRVQGYTARNLPVLLFICF